MKEINRVFMRLVIQMLIGISIKLECNFAAIEEAWKFLDNTKK